MASLKHIHTYVKYKRRPGFFRCTDSLCTHSAHKEVVEGKQSLCFFCGSVFILTKEDLRRAKPRCFNCSNTAKALAVKKASNLMSSIPTLSEELKEDGSTFNGENG